MEAPYRAVLLSQQHMKVKWSNGAANSVSVGQSITRLPIGLVSSVFSDRPRLTAHHGENKTDDDGGDQKL